MTSNAGAQMIMEPKHLGFMSGDTEKRDYERMKSGVMEEVRRMFKPEFLNRIDEIMVFHSLNKRKYQEDRYYSFEKPGKTLSGTAGYHTESYRSS